LPGSFWLNGESKPRSVLLDCHAFMAICGGFLCPLATGFAISCAGAGPENGARIFSGLFCGIIRLRLRGVRRVLSGRFAGNTLFQCFKMR
jgi:hypothetical protein